MMPLFKPLSIAALAVAAVMLSAAQGKDPAPQVQAPQIQAKEPTVVTVKGKQAQVATSSSPTDKPGKRSLPGRAGATVLRGVTKAWNAAVDLTEWGLGIKDDVDPKQTRQ